MKRFTIEVDEMIYACLTHISQVTGESIESLIVSGLYHQVAALEDGINNVFGVHEARQ